MSIERNLTGDEVAKLGNISVSNPIDLDNVASRNNYVLVKSKSDLPTPSAGKITLANNTTYELNGIIVLGTDYIECGVSNTIKGIDKSDDGIVYTGTGGAIRSTNQSFTFRDIFIQAATVGSMAFSVSCTGTSNFEIQGCIFTGCNKVGNVFGSFAKGIFRNNLVVSCANGVEFSGNVDDCVIADNLMDNFTGTATALKMTTGTYHTLIISRNMIEVASGQTAIDITGITPTASGFIQGNSIEGVGTKLVGINANSPSWKIPSNSNFGITGLFQTNRTIVLNSYSSTTSGTWLIVPQQVLTRNSYNDYETGATNLKGVLNVSMSHTDSGGQVGFRLYNITDSTVVAGTTNSPITITTGNVFQSFQTAKFTLQLGKLYRVEIIKNSGTGSDDVYINSSELEIKAF